MDTAAAAGIIGAHVRLDPPPGEGARVNLLITGIGTYLGQVVVSRLMRDNPFRRVFGLARRPPAVLGPAYFIGAALRSGRR